MSFLPKEKLRIKKKYLFTLVSLSFFIILISFLTVYFFQPKSSCSKLKEKYPSLKTISKEVLALHDGIKDASIYIGYNCLVYDVTSSKETYYGQGQKYHYLVAKDSTKQLNIFGGSIIEQKYKAVGILEN